MADSFVPETLV